MQKVPVTVITGFLGSGKTTLIRHILTHNQGLRIAVLVNEFGELGIDGELVKACGGCGEEDIIELTNGCLCCTVQEEFLPTMQRLIARRDEIDHILVETSGLALPKPLVQAFRWPEIRNGATVDGVVTIVDAASVARGGLFERTSDAPGHGATEEELVELFEDQLACADLVLLNKSDQVAPADQPAVEAHLRALLPDSVKLIAASHSRVDPRTLLGLGQAVEEQIAKRPSHHDSEAEHDHDEDIRALSVRLEGPQDPDRLVAALQRLVRSDEIYRVKGFVHAAGKPLRLVIQGVGHRFERYFDRPWGKDETRRTDLVIIGKDLEAETIGRALAEGALTAPRPDASALPKTAT
ncbi:cobalamin biosynthesis protein CobW [Gloeobacter violaceus]|uniref:CobW protein n=1 Tax=Gloeobacter violaceus (strain ATCC 29082 / PCC 7421) TaxID=251221 RepID=Q7NPD2_GLOVI|nr:cobalamin biosynthesis protein CobW [Gloeobacter violaceus]BAC88064.1 cobW [Gloeobacter violaceus PCC 7421]